MMIPSPLAIFGRPANTVPSIPSTAGAWGIFGLFNWDPVSYGEGDALEGELDGVVTFLLNAPYEANWAGLISGNQGCLWWTSLAGDPLEQRVSGQPVIDVTNKQIVFDGTGGMRGSTTPNTGRMTLYILFRVDNLATGQVICESQYFDISTAGSWSLRHIDAATGVRFSLRDSGGTARNVNVVLPDTGWHWLCVTIETSAAAAANQLVIKLDNATTGSTNTTDFASMSLNAGALYVGGDSAETWSFDGKMRLIYGRDTTDNAATQTAMYERTMYLQGLVP